MRSLTNIMKLTDKKNIVSKKQIQLWQTLIFNANAAALSLSHSIPSYQVLAVIWRHLTPLLIVSMMSVAWSHATNKRCTPIPWLKCLGCFWFHVWH